MILSQNEFAELCKNCFKQNALDAFCEQNTLFLLYQMVTHMLKVNEVINLTAITEPEHIVLKHLADSLTAAQFIPHGASVLDVGCGGGFPSLPLAIARPDLSITALDSTAKKTKYVADSAALLGLNNLKTLTGRAEELGHQAENREKYDLVTARAVAPLPILCEICIPFIKKDGYMLAMKAKLDPSELTQAPETLGCTAFEHHALELKSPRETETRVLLLAKKTKDTPKEYPRGYAQIKKKPL